MCGMSMARAFKCAAPCCNSYFFSSSVDLCKGTNRFFIKLVLSVKLIPIRSHLSRKSCVSHSISQRKRRGTGGVAAKENIFCAPVN